MLTVTGSEVSACRHIVGAATACEGLTSVGDAELEAVGTEKISVGHVDPGTRRRLHQAAVCRAADQVEQQQGGCGLQVGARQLDRQRAVLVGRHSLRMGARRIVDRQHLDVDAGGGAATLAVDHLEDEGVVAHVVRVRRVGQLVGDRIQRAQGAMQGVVENAVAQGVTVRVGGRQGDHQRLLLLGHRKLPQGHWRAVGADHQHRHRRCTVAAVLIRGGGLDAVVAIQRVGVAGTARVAGDGFGVAVTPVDLPGRQGIAPGIAGQGQLVSLAQVDFGRAADRQGRGQVQHRDLEAARDTGVAIAGLHHHVDGVHRRRAPSSRTGRWPQSTIAPARPADQAVGQAWSPGSWPSRFSVTSVAFVDILVGHRGERRRSLVGLTISVMVPGRRRQRTGRIGIVATAIGDRVGEAVVAEEVGIRQCRSSCHWRPAPARHGRRRRPA